MAWVHGMDYTPGITYSKELADLQEFLGLPRKLPEPKYPENIWAAFKRNEEKQSKRKSTNAVTVSFDSTDKKICSAIMKYFLVPFLKCMIGVKQIKENMITWVTLIEQ